MAESSKHFKKYELECHGEDCCSNSCVVDKVLLVVLDRYRDYIGIPVFLSCAFRCLTHNCKPVSEGGAGSDETSKHPKGEAADPQTPWGTNVDEMGDWLEAQPEVGAVGRYPWGCHVDVRPRVNGKVTTWDDRR